MKLYFSLMKVIALILFLLLAFCKPIFAFDPPSEQDAYGISMGRAVVAITGGIQAIEWNPAGIARAEIPMAQIGFGIDPATLGLTWSTGILYPLSDGTVFAISQFSNFPKNPTSNTTYIGTAALPLTSSQIF